VLSYLDGRVLVDWAPVAVAEPMVRALVEQLTGRDPGPLHHLCPFCGSVEHGQPSVQAPVHISVAHAPGLTLVAVSALGPVGVDVERQGDAYWVLREAVGKAVGVGITEDTLPEPAWQASVEIPEHQATVVLLSSPGAAAEAPGTARPRTAD
jgi:hypothetical protein